MYPFFGGGVFWRTLNESLICLTLTSCFFFSTYFFRDLSKSLIFLLLIFFYLIWGKVSVSLAFPHWLSEHCCHFVLSGNQTCHLNKESRKVTLTSPTKTTLSMWFSVNIIIIITFVVVIIIVLHLFLIQYICLRVKTSYIYIQHTMLSFLFFYIREVWPRATKTVQENGPLNASLQAGAGLAGKSTGVMYYNNSMKDIYTTQCWELHLVYSLQLKHNTDQDKAFAKLINTFFLSTLDNGTTFVCSWFIATQTSCWLEDKTFATLIIHWCT